MTHVKRVTKRDDYETPRELFNQLDSIYCFDLDAAASMYSSLCDNWFGLDEDSQGNALTTPWVLPAFNRPLSIFCNPPFSQKEKFLKQGIRYRNDNRVTVFLLPANAPETS